MSNSPVNFIGNALGGSGGIATSLILNARNRKAKRRAAKVQRTLSSKAAQERRQGGYLGMFNRQLANSRAVMPQEPMENVDSMQNSIPNTIQQSSGVADQVNLAQQLSPYDPLTQFNPSDLDPTGGAALNPAANEMANLQDPATRSFGVAGTIPGMFGTPFQRQRSMSNKYIKK